MDQPVYSYTVRTLFKKIGLHNPDVKHEPTNCCVRKITQLVCKIVQTWVKLYTSCVIFLIQQLADLFVSQSSVIFKQWCNSAVGCLSINFSSWLCLLFIVWGTVVHWLEHWTHDHKVVGSSHDLIVPPHPCRWKKGMGTSKLSCWEGKTDSFVQEE